MYYRLNGREPEKIKFDILVNITPIPMGLTLFKYEDELVSISTVFLSMDHSLGGLIGDGRPILFETMIFGGEYDNYQQRYHTYDEAEEGHKLIYEMVNKKAIDRQIKLDNLGI